MPNLSTYIKQQLSAGYDINAIRTALIKYGYQKAQIDAAIREVYSQGSTVNHVIHLSPTVIIAIVLVLMISLGAFFLINNPIGTGKEKQLLDLKADITTPTLNPGKDIEFDIDLINMGSASRYDISLRYLVINSANKIVKTSEETVAVETRFSKKAKVSLPPNLPEGAYQLKVIAAYDGKVATAIESFSVVKGKEEPIEEQTPEEEKEEPGIELTPIGCDDSNACTQDVLVDNECKFLAIVPCCGNNQCDGGENYNICPIDCEKPTTATKETVTIWDKLNQIEEIASKNPDSAADKCEEIIDVVFKDTCYVKVALMAKDRSYCDDIADDREKDKCIKEVAVSTEDKVLCDSIIRESSRDQCYLHFISNGEYELCDKLSNPFQKQSCEQLKRLATIS